MLQLKRANALLQSQQMVAIALTIVILLNYPAFYYAYGAFEGSVGTKKRDFFPTENPVDVCREVVYNILPTVLGVFLAYTKLLPEHTGTRRFW